MMSSFHTAKPDLRERLKRSLVANDTTHGALLERCDFCGCSVHACGCEETFEYAEVRDNPQLIAR
jgi:hypothetical protein